MRIHLGKLTIILRDSPVSISLKTKTRWYSTRNMRWYKKDFKAFKEKAGPDAEFPLYRNFPCLNDRDDAAGFVGNPYFLQDLYVAKKIIERQPKKHVDIGSRIDGFVAHVAVFREIEVFDIRPMDLSIENIVFKQADLTDETNIPVDYCDSISCLHALEHFGLGRYGDQIDPDGHLKGFRNITKILKPGGIFYFSVPMGVQRIEFNAHRIFGMPYLMNLVTKDYEVASFVYIDDQAVLHKDAVLDENNIATSFGCDLGCAIFELIKR